jgi:predicted TIM-barrel fold metal-dependent hydrolase
MEASSLPRIISVDDHVVEPPDLWQSSMPESLVADAPRVVRTKGYYDFGGQGRWTTHASKWVADPDSPYSVWADVWHYEDLAWPLTRGWADSGYKEDEASKPVTYEQIHPAAYQRDARLLAMDQNHTEVSMCFPTVPRFCGQLFLERRDKHVALASLQAYNDWMIEYWCAPRPTRLVPITLIPLWDVSMAVAEVKRCAAKGSHAIAFSEAPHFLNLPSIYSGYWDPLWAACEDTDTVVNMHVGSSSRMPRTAPDAPDDASFCLTYINALTAFTDWLYSGTLERFKRLRIAFAESQVGWIPFVKQRTDNSWLKAHDKFDASGVMRAESLPSLGADRVYGCIFDDLEGLRIRDQVGIDQILFETDFPHTDSTWPNSAAVANELFSAVGMAPDEIYKVLRGNAIRAYGLDQYFGIPA